MKTFFIAATLGCLASNVQADVAPCVAGAWQADLSEIAAIMATQMNGTATPVSGSVIMQITPAGALRTTVDGMTLRVAVPGAPEMDVSVNGYSAGTMATSGGSWTANAIDYALVGAADVLGSRMEIPFTSATGMFGSGAGSFACSGNSLSFTSASTPPKIPANWRRID